MKHDPASPPPVAHWPFRLGDIVLLAMACFAILYGGTPLPTANIVLAVVCAIIGVGLFVAPYLMEYEAKLKTTVQPSRELSDAQAKRLAHVVDQLSNVISRSQSTEEQAGIALGNLEELSDKLAAQIEELSQAIAREKDSNEKDPNEEILALLHERERQIEGLATKLSSIEKALVELAKREAPPPAPAKPPPVVPAPVPEPAKAETNSPTSLKSSAEPQTPKIAVEEPTIPKAQKPRAVHEPPVPQAELEFSPKETARKSKSNGNGGSTTTLVATAYIGIGNKLYLRGEGPGLSWDKGQLMEFLAIGKWGWKTTDASAPVSCKIYRNDETPMLDENIVIDPGERIEVAPRF